MPRSSRRSSRVGHPGAAGEAMKPLGDAFIKLIKMIIAPIIFCTVVVGIAGMEDMKKVGKTGGLALLYFEIVAPSLVVGLVIVNRQPGAGVNIDPATLDTRASRLHRPRQDADGGLLLNIIPNTVVMHFARARSCRCCCSRCCSASRCNFGGRGTWCSIDRRVRTCCSRIVGIIMNWRRSAPSARWPSRSASTAWDRCCRWAADGRPSTPPACCSSSSCWESSPQIPASRSGSSSSTSGKKLLIVLGTSSESVLPRMMAKMKQTSASSSPSSPGDPDRLLVQPGRHLDLPDDGDVSSSRRRSTRR